MCCRYGELPANLIKLTPPIVPPCELAVAWDIMWRAVAIVFVCGVESLLCSRMADRLAHNTRLPFNPNKELWGQGWVNIVCPLLNGFPHTGALARTATNIKVGAVSPLAGILKGCLKLMLAFFLRSFLEEVPMACVGGILLYVAVNMIRSAPAPFCFSVAWFVLIIVAVLYLILGVFLAALMK